MEQSEKVIFAREQTTSLARASYMNEVAQRMGNVSVSVLKWPGQSYIPAGCDTEKVTLGSAINKEEVRILLTGWGDVDIIKFYANVCELEGPLVNVEALLQSSDSFETPLADRVKWDI